MPGRDYGDSVHGGGGLCRGLRLHGGRGASGYAIRGGVLVFHHKFAWPLSCRRRPRTPDSLIPTLVKQLKQGAPNDRWSRVERNTMAATTTVPIQRPRKQQGNYVNQIQEGGFGGTREDWVKVVQLGNDLLSKAQGVEGAACSLWEVREEAGQGLDSRELDGRLHPDLLDYARDVRRRGMAARYVGPRHRVPSRLHPNARRNVAQVFKQIGKDVAKHRVLVVSSDHDCLKSAISSPFEAVDKMCPDHSISEEKRIVHDQRGVNQGTTKFLHPPAIQPAHVQIARRILWRKIRCPNLPVVMSKKDIAGAFRLLWVAPGDVELFGGDIPWEGDELQEGLPAEGEEQCSRGITVLYLVSSFGFSGSPGEWTIFGRATEEYHRAHKPSNPRRDLAIGFDAKVLASLWNPMSACGPG